MSIRSFFKPAGAGAALPPAAKRARLSDPPSAAGASADAAGSPAGSRSQHETPAKGEADGKGNSTLTPEQLERIAKNRALALERQAKNASAAAASGGGSTGSTVMEAALRMPEKWKEKLQSEFDEPYFKKLCEFHTAQVLSKKTIFPPTAEVFSAFYACDFDKISVVIVGQDPYHGKRTDSCDALWMPPARGPSGP